MDKNSYQKSKAEAVERLKKKVLDREQETGVVCPIIIVPCEFESDPPDNSFIFEADVKGTEHEKIQGDTEQAKIGDDQPGGINTETSKRGGVDDFTKKGCGGHSNRPPTEESNMGENIPHEVIQPVSFYVNHVDMDSGLIEPAEINNTLGGQFVVDHDTMAVIANPFIKQAMAKGNELPDNIVQLAQQLSNSTFQTNVGNDMRGEIANYILTPKYITVFLTRDGQEIADKRAITFTASVFEGGEWDVFEYTIPSSEIDKINNFVKRKCSFAVLYDPSDAKVIANQFRRDTKKIPRKICFEFAGWVKYAGKHVYLHKDIRLPNVQVVTSLSLPYDEQIGKRELAGIFDRATQIYWDEAVSYTLILYSFLGVLYRPFDEAGYPPHFLLFVNGLTGSYKTSISKIFFTQLADDVYRQFPRRIDADTVSSLEVALTKSGQDTVTLIDDFSPAKTMQQKNERENKLEFIIRLVGDGSSKSRSNAKLEDVRGAGLKGMVAITGELKGKGLSSSLRCLFVELEKGQVDLGVLSWFQEHQDMFTTFICHFSWFIAEHWERVVELIKIRFSDYRTKASNVLQAKRLVDTLSTLWLTTDILLIFLGEYCKYAFTSGVENRALRVKGLLQDIVIHSEELSQEDDPAKTFMQALEFLINHGEISLYSFNESGVNFPDWDGFTEKGFLYLQPELIYRKVKQHLKNNGYDLTIDCAEICKMLCESGYSETASNGNGKKLYYFRRTIGNGSKLKYIKFKINLFQQIGGYNAE